VTVSFVGYRHITHGKAQRLGDRLGILSTRFREEHRELFGTAAEAQVSIKLMTARFRIDR
jgi:hypothetical protein